jgi:prefoldin subunit 5|tara:strand:+ start:148 stop:357 length:210 start_codon:yes stop_codon:yes gene_type:complete
MDMISIYEGIVLVGGLIGVYVKLHTEVGKLKSRVHVLEQSKNDVTEMLQKLSDDIQEIKLLLARKQIDQ